MLAALTFCMLAGCGKDDKVPAGTIESGVDYDVIVVGGDPEGVCAAVSSARNGLKTLLIEDDAALGGLMTLGKLNFIDICEDRQGNILTQGLFMEFYDAVGGTAFDVETAKQFFYDWVANEENAELKLNTEFVAPVMDGNIIVGVVVEENGEEVTYTASRIIDATVDADVAAAAGVPYTIAGEDIGEKDGIRQACRADLRSDRNASHHDSRRGVRHHQGKRRKNIFLGFQENILCSRGRGGGLKAYQGNRAGRDRN